MPVSKVVFLDTSALMKRYVDEQGREEVRLLCDDAETELGASRLAQVELHSALARKVRLGELTARAAESVRAVYSSDAARDYRLALVSDSVLLLAETLVARHILRAADAIHLASALLVASALPQGVPLSFVTADRQQAAAAEAEGLEVILVGG
jgi:predicted nucleic acid-binding protein